MPRKTPDNVFALNEAREAKQGQGEPSMSQRIALRLKSVGKLVLIVLAAFIIGGIVLLQGDNFTNLKTWLDQSNGFLMLWRLVLYTGAIWLGPRWLLTPDQRANNEIVRKTRWITFFVALTLEVLLVQKGLAGLANVIQGGF